MNLATLFRWLSAMFLLSALGATATLLVSDALNQMSLTPLHRHAGALSFMLVGASCIGLQFASRRPWNTKIKELLLGIAFLFWGAEQFLAPGPWVTAMDSAVVLIFVVDLSLIIVERLKRQNHE